MPMLAVIENCATGVSIGSAKHRLHTVGGLHRQFAQLFRRQPAQPTAS